MSDTLGTILIVIGLVFAGGVYSFIKQQLPKGVVVLMCIASAMFLVLGILRYVNHS